MDAKTLAARWFDEIWNRRNPAAIHEFMHPEAVAETEGGLIVGPSSFVEQMYVPLANAFPDLTVTVDAVTGEGDDAVVRWTARTTHGAELAGIPASGKKVLFSGMTWLRFKDGKIVEGWDRWNLNALLGLLATGAATATARFQQE